MRCQAAAVTRLFTDRDERRALDAHGIEQFDRGEHHLGFRQRGAFRLGSGAGFVEFRQAEWHE